MGFPVGFKNNFSQNLILFLFVLLATILTPIVYLIRLLGLPYFKDPVFESFSKYPTRIPDLIKEFSPVVKFVDVAVSGDSTCSICLFELEEGEEIRWLKNCNHVFHKGCVDRWIDLDRNSCPLCRTPLVPCHLQVKLNLAF